MLFYYFDFIYLTLFQAILRAYLLNVYFILEKLYKVLIPQIHFSFFLEFSFIKNTETIGHNTLKKYTKKYSLQNTSFYIYLIICILYRNIICIIQLLFAATH